MVDPLGSFPWGVSLEAGGIVAAPLAAPGAPLVASGVPVPSVVLVGTMVLVASSSSIVCIGSGGLYRCVVASYSYFSGYRLAD